MNNLHKYFVTTLIQIRLWLLCTTTTCFTPLLLTTILGGTTTSGELTNHIHMEDCSYSWNTATEYGAAVCVSSLLFLQPTDSILPISIINRYLRNIAKSTTNIQFSVQFCFSINRSLLICVVYLTLQICSHKAFSSINPLLSMVYPILIFPFSLQ